MDILILIDKLDDMITAAKPVPLTDQVRIDRQRFRDVIDEMREAMPRAIAEARVRDAASGTAAAGIDRNALAETVSAAVQANIPEIARAVAAAVSSRPPDRPAPGAPF